MRRYEGYADLSGNKFWYDDERRLHREDGPAMEWNNGDKSWCINGKYHREDGPAVECNNGMKRWYYNGEYIGGSTSGFTQEDFERFLKIKEYW